jgi:hypothetical protein
MPQVRIRSHPTIRAPDRPVDGPVSVHIVTIAEVLPRLVHTGLRTGAARAIVEE